MTIVVTCACGRQQPIDVAWAGRQVRCAGCGREFLAPALGILEPASSAARVSPLPATPAASSRNVTAILACVLALFFLVGTVAGLAVLVLQSQREEIPPVAQAEPLFKQQGPVNPGKPVPPEPKGTENPPATQPTQPGTESTPTQPQGPTQPAGPSQGMLDLAKSFGQLPITYPIPEFPKAKEQPGPKSPPIEAIQPLKLVWKLRQNDTFFQELVVSQQSTFKIQGIPIKTQLQYRIVSRFTVHKVLPDGSLAVELKVESARLLQADDLTKGTLAGAVAQMPGVAYRVELSPRMEVTKFEGADSNPRINAGPMAGGMGLQMASLLDRDGWKELTQMTFFQMDQALKINDRWSKPMTHNWGALGLWSGQIHYLYMGQQAELHRVAFGLQLAYKSPPPGTVGMMAIQGAKFQTQQAEGALLFDSARGKVVGAEERFRVAGLLNANILGQNSQVEIEEDQHFALRIHDQLPR